MNDIDKDKQDLIVEQVAQIVDNAVKIFTKAKEKQVNVKVVIWVNNDGSDMATFVYDNFFYQWKSGDTFDKIANNILGDAELGTLLAYYNEIACEQEVEVGTKIKIPVLKETSANKNNKIYASPEKQDNYGCDIALLENGEFAISKSGDFDVIRKKNNLSQSLALRLTTASKKRIRLTSYGIRSTIGDTIALKSYLMSSIEETILADPRVEKINELVFSGEGDILRINVSYTDINNELGNYVGEI